MARYPCSEKELPSCFGRCRGETTYIAVCLQCGFAESCAEEMERVGRYDGGVGRMVRYLKEEEVEGLDNSKEFIKVM